MSEDERANWQRIKDVMEEKAQQIISFINVLVLSVMMNQTH